MNSETVIHTVIYHEIDCVLCIAIYEGTLLLFHIHFIRFFVVEEVLKLYSQIKVGLQEDVKG